MAFGWLKTAGKKLLQVAPVAAAIADLSGVPYAGRIGRIIVEARERGGSGKEQGEFALSLALADAPAFLAELEAKVGRKVPATVAAEYIRAQIQAHYDLMRALGAIEKAP